MPSILQLNTRSDALGRNTCAVNDTKMGKRQTWTRKINKQEWRPTRRSERAAQRWVLQEKLSLRRDKIGNNKELRHAPASKCVCANSTVSHSRNPLWRCGQTRLSNIRIHFVFMRFRSSAITNDIHSCRSERRRDALECSDALLLRRWPSLLWFHRPEQTKWKFIRLINNWLASKHRTKLCYSHSHIFAITVTASLLLRLLSSRRVRKPKKKNAQNKIIKINQLTRAWLK